MAANELSLKRIKQWQKMLESFEAKGIHRIPIWGAGQGPTHPTHSDFKAGLYIYPVQQEKRGIVVILAGGAFMHKAYTEAEPTADYFHAAGLNVAVLDYSTDETIETNEHREIIRLNAGQDALQAVRYLRAHADALGIDGTKIAVGGFSAGGMTCQQAATMFDNGNPTAEDPVLRVSSRPDAVLLLYGAFNTLAGGFSASFSMEALHAEAMKDPVRLISCDCPPVFIFQTLADDTRGSLRWASELVDRGIPYEIHIFEGGPHGGGLYDGKDEKHNDFPHTAHWAELAKEWLVRQSF